MSEKNEQAKANCWECNQPLDEYAVCSGCSDIDAQMKADQSVEELAEAVLDVERGILDFDELVEMARR